MGASVKLSPIAPPIMLNPWMWSTTSGNVANSKATFVNVPVATTHGVPFGWDISAFRIAKMGFSFVIGGTDGLGRRSVPSRPDSPEGQIRT
jgi:hypothetical protein